MSNATQAQTVGQKRALRKGEVEQQPRAASVRMVEQVRDLKDIQQELEESLKQRYQMAAGINRDGKEIVVPAFMTLQDAAGAIMSFEKEQNTEEDTLVELFSHPYDCCNAFNRAVSEIYGQMVSAENMGFFGPMNGKCLTVPTGHSTSIKVPMGATKVPGLPIQMNIGVSDPLGWAPGGRGAFVKFTAKRMYAPLLQDIERRTKSILAKESIFQSVAIDSKYQFLNVDNFDREKVIYSADQTRQLEANVFTLIKNKDRAIAANIPIKRGILLHGPYGTGKTLTALYVGSLCVENGWTFILVKPGDPIDAAIEMAQKVQPACVFFEDIDAVAVEERDEDVNSILNTIDGVLSKDSEVMVILTTNHIEKVNPAMLRPGRLDAVIKLGELDEAGIIRFIKACATDSSGQMMIDDDLDGTAIFLAAQGYTPAFLKEAVSKATLYAISRGAYNGKSAHICSADIVDALHELRPQFEMMAGPRTEKKASLLGELDGLIQGLVKAAVAETEDRVSEAAGYCGDVNGEAMKQRLEGSRK